MRMITFGYAIEETILSVNLNIKWFEYLLCLDIILINSLWNSDRFNVNKKNNNPKIAYPDEKSYDTLNILFKTDSCFV